MRFCLKKIIYCPIFLLMSMPALSQTKTVHAENVTGKIIGNEPGAFFKKIDQVKNLDKTKVASLKKCLNAQLKIFFSDPLLNPPSGFVEKTSFGISTDPFAKVTPFPACTFSFGFYYLDSDNKSGVKTSMDGTSIGMETNAEDHFFRQVGNFWKGCSNAGFPLFFEELPITDSTADYLELDFRKYGYAAIAPGKPFRIIKRNEKPLFVPLTRKEFVQFLIAQKKYQIKDDEKTIAYLQKEIKESQKTLKDPSPYITESIKKTLADAIKVTEGQTSGEEEGIKNKQAKIKEYESLINAMTLAESASAARIDEDKRITGFDQSERLVSAGRMEGVGLYKINPDYYDRSPGAPAAQLIFVYYEIPNLSVFEKTTFNYLEKKTMDIFNHIDYHQLKESMR